ncbi:MAG TPA: GFA family protein [candidate division Zixibacteria bacterium]|nr:GFA family protein [candidate division Zixibacteria bacterium]
MAEEILRGSCLCGSVRYEVSPPFLRFGHCYCSRCRKATGGVRSTNIAVAPAQFRWTQGPELVRRFDLPQARSFARQVCGSCYCPVPHVSRDGQRVIVPSGTLDDVPPGKPSVHGHWSSRVSWVEIDESNLPRTD